MQTSNPVSQSSLLVVLFVFVCAYSYVLKVATVIAVGCVKYSLWYENLSIVQMLEICLIVIGADVGSSNEPQCGIGNVVRLAEAGVSLGLK